MKNPKYIIIEYKQVRNAEDFFEVKPKNKIARYIECSGKRTSSFGYLLKVPCGLSEEDLKTFFGYLYQTKVVPLYENAKSPVELLQQDLSLVDEIKLVREFNIDKNGTYLDVLNIAFVEFCQNQLQDLGFSRISLAEEREVKEKSTEDILTLTIVDPKTSYFKRTIESEKFKNWAGKPDEDRAQEIIKQLTTKKENIK